MLDKPRSPGAARAIRSLDFSEIRAVGFDLDHTLAVYDDDAINTLACAEAARLLVDEAGYPKRLVEANYDGSRVARGLMMEFGSGAIVKMDESRRVQRAYHGGRLLRASEHGHLIEAPIDSSGAHPLHSPFDLPTGWLFMTMVSDATVPPSGYAHVCADIRHMLDRSHTVGELKTSVMKDLSRFVRPLRQPQAFAQLRDTGLTLFVLTNSERDYAVALLDYLFDRSTGLSWRDVFEDVVVSAAKPEFFKNDENVPTRGNTGDPLHEGGGARALETRIGFRAGQVLYIGDHAEYDVAAAARHGWRTAHILPELVSDPADLLWGSVFHDSGGPTWFSKLIVDHADVVAGHVEELIPGLLEQRIPPGDLPVSA